MLGFVGQMRASIFHLCNLRIRIVRVLPVVVVALFLALAVQLCQLFAGRRLDAGFFCKTSEKVIVTLTVIPADDRAQRGVGFQRGSVHGNGVAFQQAFFRQHAQHPQKHFAMRFHIDQTARPRNGRMIRR